MALTALYKFDYYYYYYYDYITDLLTPVASIPTRSSLRASSNGDLHLLRTERRIGDRAFSVAAPHAWNRLPTELKLMQQQFLGAI